LTSDTPLLTRSETFHDVAGLLRARSIAVVGASDAVGNLAGAAVRNLVRFGFDGEIWPVHPRETTVAGIAVHASVSALPGAPDLAILGVGAARVPDTLRELGERGGRNAIVWAGGFAEGGDEGAALQRELVDTANEYGIRVLGPNCLGIVSADVTASFASFLADTDDLPRGDISIVGQSGGTVMSALAHLSRRGFGIRYGVSTGNEALVGTADFIAAFADDPGTRVIATYVEGTRDGEKLSAALAKARDAGKPVVLLRGGASAAAQRAAAAHTGALAGEDRVWRAVLAENGVMEVRSLEELLDVVQQISSGPDKIRMDGDGIAIVTFGGGAGVLSADQAARHGLTVAAISDAVRMELKPLIAPIASAGNPFDLTPQTYQVDRWLQALPVALDAIAAAPGVDAVLLQYGPMAMNATAVAQISKDFMARAPIPVLLGWDLPPAIIPGWLKENDVHSFSEFDRALRVLGHYARWSAASRYVVDSAGPFDFDWEGHVPDAARGTTVSEYACHALLSEAQLAVAGGRLVQTAEEAGAAGAELGWPVAVKGMSRAVTHKFAAGLVRLGIGSADEAEEAARSVLARTSELGVEPEGVYVQHMVGGDAEILVSALRDPAFGVVVSVGAGGVLTELIDDVALRRAPFGPETAERMLRSLRTVEHLERKRGEVDLASLASFVARFSQLAASAPWAQFVLEVNPVKWSPEGVAAVDGLLIVEEV